MGRPPALTASGRHRTETGHRRGLPGWTPTSAGPPRGRISPPGGVPGRPRRRGE